MLGAGAWTLHVQAPGCRLEGETPGSAHESCKLLKQTPLLSCSNTSRNMHHACDIGWWRWRLQAYVCRPAVDSQHSKCSSSNPSMKAGSCGLWGCMCPSKGLASALELQREHVRSQLRRCGWRNLTAPFSDHKSQLVAATEFATGGPAPSTWSIEQGLRLLHKPSSSALISKSVLHSSKVAHTQATSYRRVWSRQNQKPAQHSGSSFLNSQPSESAAALQPIWQLVQAAVPTKVISGLKPQCV